MSEWLGALLVVTPIIATIFVVSKRQWKRNVQALLARRPNPTRVEFVELLSHDVPQDIAEWMWETVSFYTRPLLSPHPDDDLLSDLMIDDDDVYIDWLPQFAKEQGLDWKAWPDWPSQAPSTVRNFAIWLAHGRDLQRPVARQAVVST